MLLVARKKLLFGFVLKKYDKMAAIKRQSYDFLFV
jgi:hypothetical protein